MTETRNILIIGRTRNGKSSLANTLVNKGGILKQVFKESNRSVSSTKKSQNEVFNWKGIDYRVVDTIGLGDTKLPHKEISRTLSRKKKKKNFKLLKEVMFESGVTPYATIVRTNFDLFRDEK